MNRWSAFAFVPIVMQVLQAIQDAESDPGFSEHDAENLKQIARSTITATDNLVDIPEGVVVKLADAAIDLSWCIGQLTALSNQQILDMADEIRAGKATDGA